MSTDSHSYVVVGGGLAAATAVTTLREQGYAGRLVLIGAETHPPYERPPLSKGYLAGTDALADAFVHPTDWYADHDVELRLGAPATSIDVAAQHVVVAEEHLRYDRLLVATGCAPRRLPMADASGAPVAYLRTIEDSDRIRAALRPGRRVGIIGGGWIGLEVAAAARTAGCEVVVIERDAAPLLAVLGPEVADVFADLHREHGVDLRTNIQVQALHHAPDRAVVKLDQAGSVEADLLVVGVGAVPNTGLADAAGLPVDNGIVVDARLRTPYPDVLAAGDVANAHHATLGRHLRVEHWDNAIAQGAAAARNMLGADEVFDRLPYFFTDQYDLGMEYVGHIGPDGYDDVVMRGDVRGRVFTAYWLKGDRVLAGMHVNDWDAMDDIRRAVAAGSLDAASAVAHEPSFDGAGP